MKFDPAHPNSKDWQEASRAACWEFVRLVPGIVYEAFWDSFGEAVLDRLTHMELAMVLDHEIASFRRRTR